MEVIKIFVAIFVGTFTYVITKFYLEHFLEQRLIKAEIAENLIKYANVYSSHMTNPDDAKEASSKFKELLARLSANKIKIPFYKLFEKVRIVLSIKIIDTTVLE